MGDRGNIAFVQHTWNPATKTSEVGGAVFLYTHWAGYRAQELARSAIDAAKARWGDESYATRIALTHLIGDVEGDTGFGVSITPGENHYPLPVIDWEAMTVAVLSANGGDTGGDTAAFLAAYDQASKVPFDAFTPPDTEY